MNTKVTPTVSATPSRHSTLDLLLLADQCVKCGLCLAHCPTYAKTRQEADSPRGRIALIQGWAMGQLSMTTTLAGHLDGCLTCRACESACPSLVAYGRLADVAKAHRTETLPVWRRISRRFWIHLLSNARIMTRLGAVSRAYRVSGLARLADAAGIKRLRGIATYHRLAKAMSLTARPLPSRNPAHADCDLFIGCMGSSALGGAVQATLRVSEALGLRLNLPSAPGCCGAMLRHNGYSQEADHLRDRCAQDYRGRVLVGLASACVAELREHAELASTWELCAYLDQIAWPAHLELQPLDRRVLVHEPCSHRHLLGGNGAVFRLLARIPKLRASPLPENHRCCGAAGTYLIQQPRMANALLEDKMTHITDLKPDIIVTTNPGCALHLIAGIQEAGLEIEVCHPIELIARQIETAPETSFTMR